jgi:eukaryotic-like serine/threonine-protein kinase
MTGICDPITVVLPTPAPGSEMILSKKTWRVVSPLAADPSGFAAVYIVEDEQGGEAVAKLVEKAPAAEREALIGEANLAAQYRNVVPVVDHGEYDDALVLVMPRAEMSLQKHLDDQGGSLEVDEAIRVLTDIATALADIQGAFVHRDLKPANVLLLGGSWSLSDFGLARYALATTGTDTWKYNATWLYASPEQWRGEHATELADVYAFGVLAYQLLAGNLPFMGPDLRAQHLGETPPPLTVEPPRLRDLVDECLYKAPGARPTASAILTKLGQIAGDESADAGLAALEQANSLEVKRRADADAQRSAEQEFRERNAELQSAATESFRRVTERMIEVIRARGSTVQLLFDRADRGRFPIDSPASGKALLAILNGVQLGVDNAQPSPSKPGTLPFTVVSESVITLLLESPVQGWRGRSHSLWFCNAVEEDRFAWYEHAFTTLAMGGGGRQQLDPFALDTIDAGPVFAPGVIRTQRSWNFEELDRSNPSAFISRWLGWFGRAAQGQLQPSAMTPEQPIRQDYWWRK